MNNEFKTWTPSNDDFNFGRILMTVEDYSKTVQVYSTENIHFCALLYSVLSARESFRVHREQFNSFLEYDLNTAEKVLEKPHLVSKILTQYGFHSRKIESVLSIAKEWGDLDITSRMREDKQKVLGKAFREEMNEKMNGVGYKFASLFIRMSGYEDIVPIDTWAIKYVERRGFMDRYKESGLTPKQYLNYERKIKQHAKRLGVSPALLQATVYARWSTWRNHINLLS